MRVPLSLLQKFFSQSLSLEQVIGACDRIGIETEIEAVSPDSLGLIVTAQVIRMAPHPNADKLVVATVFDGKEERQIVCGAPNCREGIIIPLALPGAKLRYNDGTVVTIMKSKIRGVESHGMCCGADELGFAHLQKSARGIHEFPEGTPLGVSACPLLAGAVIECSLTPNLGHCASLLGLAREIAQVTGIELVVPNGFSFAPVPSKKFSSLHHRFDLCPLFCSVKISGVTNQPSPEVMQKALLELKQKPINALVDITNYIMLMLGQPLHVYDAAIIDQDSLSVESVTSETSLMLLNGETVLIPEGTAVVRDAKSVAGLAGVMGGWSSSCKDNTKTVILESAYFLPKVVRFAQRHLPIHSEAAYRFARGTDPRQVLPALYAAIHHIQKCFPQAEIAPIQILGDVPASKEPLTLRMSTVRRLLGQDISVEAVALILMQLGFNNSISNDSLQIEIPSYRHDIREEIDLIEELCRVKRWRIQEKKSEPLYLPVYALKRKIVDFLAHNGLQQFFTCDLLDPDTASLTLASTELLTLQGSKQATALRGSLLSGLLKSVATNLNRQAIEVQAFEVGAVYGKGRKNRYLETETLGIILAGQEPPSWLSQGQPFSFYTIKGWVEHLCRYLNINLDRCTLIASKDPNFHPYQQAQIYYNKLLLGSLGLLHPKLCRKAQIRHNVFFAELVIGAMLVAQEKQVPQHTPYPIYPSSYRDTTIPVPEDLHAEILRKKLLSFDSKWLERVSVISVYRNQDADSRMRNISLRLVFRSSEKTLSNQEIDEEQERLLAQLNRELMALQGSSGS